MDRRARLHAYVASALGHAVVIGQDDCYPWVLQWVAQEIGQPVPWPSYRTRDEGCALIERAGGIVRMASDVLSGTPLRPTFDPQVGDVGIIHMRKDIPVIFCGFGNAIARDEAAGARYIQRLEIVQAWAVPDLLAA